ncbi:polypeptide chain release factor methylase [Strigomonas culicis]|nr:polypeptide chain release factor methylase [Strigomonas culicis]|eukprot:EPY22925.1 polypeptide chain release factor methylase [Strigomonas culicis]
MLKKMESRILIKRDFWVLDDFNDAELNSSFGVQNLYFDNYKWSQVLWKRFQAFVEEYFPLSEHSHLRYSEYMELIKSFSVFEQGTHALPVLPKSVVLHPPYGVKIPSAFSLEPLLLYKNWLSNYRAVLSLNRALVCNAGSSVAAFATKLAGVSMVKAVDARPRAVKACRSDAKLNRKCENVSFQVATFFPGKALEKQGHSKRYDLVFFFPDEEIVNELHATEGVEYAPGTTGVSGSLEQFFENVSDYLADSGVAVVCCTNISSLLKPEEPHPIEYEIKVNRRFVLLDYFDSPLASKGPFKGSFSDPKIENTTSLRAKLRSELWVLHKIDSLNHFAAFHGIPGAKPPPNALKWKSKNTTKRRQQVLKNHVELMGGDWENYKARLIHSLREQSDVQEDDVAEAIRMTIDPSYPLELAKKSKNAVESRLREQELFHKDVSRSFTEKSPREFFDDHFRRLY